VTDDALAIVRTWLETIAGGSLDDVTALAGPGFVHHSNVGDLGLDEFRSGIAYYRAAFAGARYEITAMHALDDGSGAVVRWTMLGRHTGTFAGSGPTGREIAMTGMSLHRIEDGRVVEEWEFSDDTGLLESLGFTFVPPARDTP
jgi:steroid delta-isomerase-like uncharacterized protein